MADTTITSPSVKKYVDYAQQQVDEQAILDKYNAATVAQYNLQREQNRAAENQFYNQMYNTQRTAMDTIRQSNAAAVASGASRGVQAANELAAILGLQQESVQGATEIAQANRQTAQEETAAVLENVLAAYQQASQERAQLVQQGIESASVDAQEQANMIASQEAETNRMNAETQRRQQASDEQAALTAMAANGTDQYLAALKDAGYDYNTNVGMDGYASLGIALNALPKTITGADGQTIFVADDWAWSNTGSGKADQTVNQAKKVCEYYGITWDKDLDDLANSLRNTASEGHMWGGKDEGAQASNNRAKALFDEIQYKYLKRVEAVSKANTNTK